MKISIKSLRCEHINPKIYNGSVKCSIKPTRNGNGITNVRYTYGKPCNDLWVHIILYYQFLTSTQFRPWMLNFDENICKLAGSSKGLGGFAYHFARSVLKFAPGLLHACPYFGEEGLKDGNIDAIMNNALPQIAPKGMYKMLMRFHTTNNDTFLNVWLTAYADARDPMQAFEMGK